MIPKTQAETLVKTLKLLQSAFANSQDQSLSKIKQSLTDFLYNLQLKNITDQKWNELVGNIQVFIQTQMSIREETKLIHNNTLEFDLRAKILGYDNSDILPIYTMLLDLGMNLNIQNAQGETALYSAAVHGDVEKMKLLLTRPGIDPNRRHIKGTYPLYWILHSHCPAEQAHKMELVELFIRAKAEISAPLLRGDSCTALELAYHNKNEAMLELLIKHGAQIKDSVGNRSNPQPLIFTAIRDGNEKVIQAYLDQGNDINATFAVGKNLRSPLTCAVISRNQEVVQFLLRKGANPIAFDGTGANSIQLANAMAIGNSSPENRMKSTAIAQIINPQGPTKNPVTSCFSAFGFKKKPQVLPAGPSELYEPTPTRNLIN